MSNEESEGGARVSDIGVRRARRVSDVVVSSGAEEPRLRASGAVKSGSAATPFKQQPLRSIETPEG
jgi:hypothetical protein